MPTLHFLKPAENDLWEIARFTEERFGFDQAQDYIRKLRATCADLAQFPDMGRPFAATHPERKRFEIASHVIFYRKLPGKISVQRILHKSMVPKLHGIA